MGYDDGPVDDTARATLAAHGLDLRLVPADDREVVDAWGEAVSRGFLGGERTDDARTTAFEVQRERRRLGVYDASGPSPELPVGTFADWASELSVPGGSLPALAITSVTVAPTHRRRGIARALMEGELRRAASAGLPAAILTVSESTLYGRYGFGPAADSASWRIDTKRAGWRGVTPGGRVDFVSRAAARDLLDGLHARVRGAFPGEAAAPGGHWEELLGTRGDVEDAKKIRAVRYAGADGAVEGVVVYSVADTEEDFAGATATVRHLLAATEAAYAALWHFVLSLDLVTQVRASELSVEEPLRWMIADPRAATVTISDHHYVRILDIPAAFSARRYGAAGTLVLDVDDPLGIAGGRFVLEVDDAGIGTARPWAGDSPAGAVHVALGAVEVAMLFLGGVSAATLAAAGRITTADAPTVSRILGWHIPARLSFWY